MSELHCVVITPEQTELDVTAESVTLPLFDGEMGILVGHSPLVGRLGYGSLRVKRPGGEAESYFVEGGFAQVVSNTISVLTDNMTPMAELTADAARDAMRTALDMPTDDPEQIIAREKAVNRARALVRLTSS